MARLVLTTLLLLALLVPALTKPVTRQVVVDGLVRTALVYPGKQAATAPAPLLLVFHGFTGSSDNAARLTRFHEVWPEATVVYPQGLSIYSTRRKMRVPAWQVAPGKDDDRDVHFIDALLKDLFAAYKVDDHRVYVTGMSNGAMFAYTLFAMHPEPFAAFAPVAGSVGFIRDAKVPRPMLIIQGKTDTTALPEWAANDRDMLRQLNGCGTETTEWAPGYESYQPCLSGQPVIWHLHDGGHIWPDDATRMIVKFFKEQALE